MSKRTKLKRQKARKQQSAQQARKPAAKGARLVSFQVTDEPIPDPDYDALPEAVQDRANKLYFQMRKEPVHAVGEALKLIKDYPHIPQFRNHLYVAYMYSGQENKAEALMLETYRLFPDYLFGRVNYVEYLLKKDRADEVPAALGGVFDLSMMYPERKVFHTTEVISFFTVVGCYYAKIGKIEAADLYIQMLRQIDAPPGNISAIMLEKRKKNFAKLLA